MAIRLYIFFFQVVIIFVLVLVQIDLMGPRGASLAIFVSLADAPRSVVAVGFDNAQQGQYY